MSFISSFVLKVDQIYLISHIGYLKVIYDEDEDQIMFKHVII